MHARHLGGRQKQFVHLFKGGQVVCYMPCDGRDVGNNAANLRMVTQNENTVKEVSGIGSWEVGDTNPSIPSIHLIDAFAELDNGFWAEQGVSSSNWHFRRDVDFGGGLKLAGIPIDGVNRSYAVIAAGVARGAAAPGYLIDINPDYNAFPDRMRLTSAGFLWVDQTNDPGTTVAAWPSAETPISAGDQVFSCGYWRNDTRKVGHIGYINGAVDAAESAALSSPTHSGTFWAGFVGSAAVDYVGFCILMFDDFPTNLVEQCTAMANGWFAGNRNLSWLEGLTP